ncbi:MAG TPA: P-loop NTPase fold protein [Kribbella sp.]|nr:P-loop NTPase fold protein [Kribbella sp.]
MAAERVVTLQQLIKESGHVEDRRIGEFAARALAVQRFRHDAGISNTTRITRSTALLALMMLDPKIRAAVEVSGVTQTELAAALSLSGASMTTATGPAELHDEFERALRTYLADRPLQPAISLMDVATAILRDGRDRPIGLLPERLKKLDYARALAAVGALTPRVSGSATSVQADAQVQAEGRVGEPPALSESMQAVARELSSAPEPVSSFTVVEAVARRHPEYADRRLGTIASVPDAQRLSWAEWEEKVAQGYEREALARSVHGVLDGRLFLAGLALADPALHQAMVAADVWTPLLLEIDDRAAPVGSPLGSVLHEIQFGYGYRSDQASGEDQLGIQGEVNAVCAVVTDPVVKPPLAVGLFGEWGSGKSFFMDKMRQRVAELTTPSTTDSQETKPLNVIQIRFNAWHYSDSSLWSSLAIEIFERLVDPEPVDEAERAQWLLRKGDPKRTERKDLLSQLETYRGAKAALDAERAHLETERAALAERRDEATKQRLLSVQKASFTDVAGALAEDPTVRRALDQVARQLDLKPAVGELQDLASELRTTTGYLPTVWRLVQHKTWTVALAAAFVVLALTTAALAVRPDASWLGSLATGIGSVAAVVVAVVGWIRPAARQVNRALKVIESAVHASAEVEAKLRSRREREKRVLEVTLAAKDHEIAQATQAIAALDEKIAATEAAAEALTVGRRLYDFLADRAAGYQKHQGVVGMLHRDFRLLDAQLLAYRTQTAQTPGWPAADRVVLYIDDLDRCAPSKVLEVLEAVHLLLALELFVVVVGVDPRWLERSLRHQYRELVSTGEPGADPYLRAMPIEYLEKIFQIPLTLPAMEPTGYARLIASLAPTTAVPTPTPAGPAVPGTTRRATSGESPGGDRAPTRASLDVQPGSAASGSRGRPIDLTPAEVTFAQKLGPLVDSPRAAKRLMNTYRLIRATQHVGSRSRFLGVEGQAGEYQVVLSLLAVAAGYPTMADRVLVALQDDARTHAVHTWPAFVAALAPATASSSAGSLVPKDLDLLNDPERTDSAVWANLHRALTACLPAIQLAELEPYQRWGRIVARFSFTL